MVYEFAILFCCPILFRRRAAAPRMGQAPAMTDNKLAELRPAVYDALMNGGGNTSRFHMAPGTSSARRPALESCEPQISN
jgi:hypothetical protein